MTDGNSRHCIVLIERAPVSPQKFNGVVVGSEVKCAALVCCRGAGKEFRNNLATKLPAVVLRN